MSFKLFEYVCKKCKWEGEILSKKDDKPKCPTCKSTRLQKVLNYAGYTINGSNGSSVRPKNAGSFKKAEK